MFYHKPGSIVAVLKSDNTPNYKAEVLEYRKRVDSSGTFESYTVSCLSGHLEGAKLSVLASSVVAWPKHGLFHGARVGTHPATDEWVRGDRYGTIQSTTDNVATVRLDSGRVRNFQYFNLINPDTKQPYEEASK